MSDFGVWESIESSDSEKKIASRKSEDRLAAAIYDVKDKYGEFLYASTAIDEFHDRVALVKTDMMKTVDAHLMPVTGVMRRVIKACKDEWRYRTAAPEASGGTGGGAPGGSSGGGLPPGVGGSGAMSSGPGGFDPQPNPDLGAMYNDTLNSNATPNSIGQLMSPGLGGNRDSTNTAGSGLGPVTETAPINGYAGELKQPSIIAAGLRQAGESVHMKNIPECDICKYENGKSGVPAAYDGKTQYGPWANMCEDHFKSHGVGLGTGRGQRLTSTRRRADMTGPAMDLEDTFAPSSGNLVPEGNFDGYLAEVEQGAPEKAGENFIEGGRRYATDHGFMRQDGTCPDCFWASAEAKKSNPEGFAKFKKGDGSMSYGDLLKHHHPGGSEVGGIGRALGPLITGSVDFAVYKDYCETNGLRVASIDSLDHYAENLSDAQYFRIASIIERIGADALTGASPGSTIDQQTNGHASVGDLQQDMGLAASQSGLGNKQSRRRQAAGGKTNYLEKADEALTQVLESKAEEFQQTIAPLQQALQVIQQAEQAEQAANPMGVQPPPGTVNVLPGQDPSMGGGDPSMGGGDPMAGGGGDLAQALGLAGAQGVPSPGPEGAQQQITGHKVAKDYGRKCPECKSVNTDYSPVSNDYDCYDCGVNFKPYSNSKKKPKKESFKQARGEHDSFLDDPVIREKYPYGGMDDGRFDPDLYRPSGPVDFADLDPDAQGDIFEDFVGMQHEHQMEKSLAGGHDAENWDECPECLEGADPELIELAKGYKKLKQGGRQDGGAYPFVRRAGILDQYNSWLKKRKDLPRGGEADYWAFARENGFGQNEVNSLINHFSPQKAANRVSSEGGDLGTHTRTSGLRSQRSGTGPISGSYRSSSEGRPYSAGQDAEAQRERKEVSRSKVGRKESNVAYPQSGDAGLSGRGQWSGDSTPQRSGARQSTGESGVWDSRTKLSGYGSAQDSMAAGQNPLSRRTSAGRAESDAQSTARGSSTVSRLRSSKNNNQESSGRFSGSSRHPLSEDNDWGQRLAWTGFGPAVFARDVPGWEFDSHLNGYVTTAARDFTCSCGEKLPVPSYSTCKCGKVHNSYVIGTGGDNHTASIEKYICREIQVRPDVIVANRKAKRHKLTDPGALDEGEEDDLPTMKPVPQDWRRRNEHGQFSAKRR